MTVHETGIQNLRGGQPDSFNVQAAATVPIAGKTPKSWLRNAHPVHQKFCLRWKHVMDFYLGEVADKDCARDYLIKRYQGEPEKAFQERVQCADYTPHFGTIVDTIAGMLFAVEDRASRVWVDADGKGALGDPTDLGSAANLLWVDADGHGIGWPTLWRQCAIDLINYQYLWVLVDTVHDRHVVKLIPPTMVPNWADDMSVVLMKEHAVQMSLEDEEPRETFIKWTLAGWERWYESKEGLPVKVGGDGYKYVDRAGQPTLPIFRVELPIRRYVAWLLAKKAAVMFNQESVRDFALRLASFTKLILSVGSKEQYEELLKKLLAGENVLPEDKSASGGHRYIAPDGSPIQLATDILKEKREDLWTSGFKLYANAAREATATEIKQDVAAGIGAFLQLLKAAVDDCENGAFWRLEQAVASESQGMWGIAHVERSDDFSAIDIGATLDQLKKRYLGDAGKIPVGRSALIRLAKDAAQADGLSASDEEITAAVDSQLLLELQKALEDLGATPPTVKSRLTMRLVAALGLVDPKEMIELEDGQKVSLLKQLEQESTTLAEEKAAADKLAAQLPPPGRF